MENKISLISLASSLSRSSGKSKKQCEDFLKEFFKLAADVLEQGESIRIKGFGSFKIGEVDSRTGVNVNTGERHEFTSFRKVVFTPSKELASVINSPFEDFESIEMEDSIPEEIFLEGEDTAQEAEQSLINKEAEEMDIRKEEELNEPAGLSDENDISNYRLEEGSEEENSDDKITYEAYNEEREEPQASLTEYEPETTVRSRFGIGFLIGSLSTFAVSVVIFMLGCFFDWWPVNFGNVKEADIVEHTETPMTPLGESSDTDETEVEQPQVVYDTVSTTRYLTTIARDHYGNFNFWPYIYKENEQILGHPDRITPGTQVVVPDLAKYGVDPTNRKDIEDAKKMGLEIYSRFK